MNEQNDLMQDISNEGNNSNLRKYLLLGGGVFVLFVVGIVAAKVMFSQPKKNDTAVILPPEVTMKQKKDNTALFNEIPVENDTEFKKPNVEMKEELPKETVHEVEPVIETPVQETTKPQPKPKPVEVKKVEPKKIEQKVTKKSNVTQKYYIQVAATRGKPSEKFLKLIKKNGFEYKIVEVNVKGIKVKRILVGGYSTYKDVKKALPSVKSKISSSAFIKVLK